MTAKNSHHKSSFRAKSQRDSGFVASRKTQAIGLTVLYWGWDIVVLLTLLGGEVGFPAASPSDLLDLGDFGSTTIQVETRVGQAWRASWCRVNLREMPGEASSILPSDLRSRGKIRPNGRPPDR